ncbi:hypothetical protein Pcinc_022577 [Petrolisthes cinctipes]|uniref:Uncharacterized protein n=1 Tax=Petrolisthes cinctipes TaxID=88211 RepID=A0AAE1FFD0_PETCI|nr:hypothetical protein Pcinc_022577 [Petrolisthes cinctipes]
MYPPLTQPRIRYWLVSSLIPTQTHPHKDTRIRLVQVPYLQPTPMTLRLLRGLLGAAVLLWSLPPCHCFNLEAREALVIPFPGQQRDRNPYFGLALALQKQRDDPGARLIVGAPRANSSTFEPGIKEPGAVFRCSLDSLECDELKMDPDYGNGERQTVGGKTYKNYKQGGWVGGALDSQPTYQSDHQASTAVCSPRWVNTYYGYYDSHQMNGVCYWFNQTLPTNPQKMMPLTVSGQQVYRNRYHYYHGQVGFSVHFTNDSAEMILGAPGVTNWRGSVVRARRYAPRFSRRRQNAASSFSDYFVPNMYDTSSIDAFDLLGYAVTSGYYLDPTKLLYGAGAPKAGKGNGKAIIFSYPLEESSGLLVIQEMVGSQMGSNFGASLTTLDINGDGLSDLVVGAPTYIHQRRHDAGRVVVFLSSRGGLLEQGTTAYHGSSSSGARFGTTVAAIGDLNGDQYEDFVVGAPFEGNGAIYVILGSGSGLPLTHSQRLGAEAFPGVALRGFGMALSRGVDVDDNAYPDVAIGSFLSGHAVVVKSRPIARLRSTLTAIPSTLQLTSSDFMGHYYCEKFTDEQAELWEKLGSKAKFYCRHTVRNCEEMANRFILGIVPLEGKVNWNKQQIEDNTHRIEELENTLSLQQTNIKEDTETAMKQAIGQVNIAMETDKINLKGAVKEEVSAVLRDQKEAATNIGAGVATDFKPKNQIMNQKKMKYHKTDVPRMRRLFDKEYSNGRSQESQLGYEYEKKIALDFTVNVQHFWAYVQSKTNAKESLNRLKTSSGNITDDDTEITQEMNKAFN